MDPTHHCPYCSACFPCVSAPRALGCRCGVAQEPVTSRSCLGAVASLLYYPMAMGVQNERARARGRAWQLPISRRSNVNVNAMEEW